ncbi:MAG: hypothetical protein M0017_02115 [Desulfobacteraceae bacterium]|nr:hypothetical protein [Desulfobacteraceae bacterium]
MKPIRFAALLLLTALWPAATCLGFAEYADKVPSCNDQIAKGRTTPGTAPSCTPAILESATALRIMQSGMVVRKIKGKWYLFLSEEQVKKDFDAGKRWQSISLLVSAVQSLFAKGESCYLARVPRTEAEKKALLAGNYPRRLIAASAEAVPPGPKPVKESAWPEYHHHILYKLTVY